MFQLSISIVGCGYVGLPLALRFAEAGHCLTGFDTDPVKVEKLNRGESYIEHIPASKIRHFVISKYFSATRDFKQIANMDAVIICVPTPLDERRDPDLSYIEKTALAIAPHLQRGQLIVLESTTYPGTTEELVLPILEKGGLRCRFHRAAAHRKSSQTFSSPFLLSEKTPAISNMASHRFPKWLGERILPAPARPLPSMRKSSLALSLSLPRARPRWSSYSKTSFAA